MLFFTTYVFVLATSVYKANSAFHPHGANYAVKAGVVCWQVKLCDSHLSALEVSSLYRRYTNLRLPLPLPLRRSIAKHSVV